MGHIGVKMNILWVKQIQWQFGNYWKRIFNKPAGFTFSERENVFHECALDCGFKNWKAQGLFRESYPEGVSSNLSRRPEISRWMAIRGVGWWPAAISTVEPHGRRGRSSPEFVIYVISGTIWENNRTGSKRSSRGTHPGHQLKAGRARRWSATRDCGGSSLHKFNEGQRLYQSVWERKRGLGDLAEATRSSAKPRFR